MKFYEILEKCLKIKKVEIYFDLDGVIAEYDIGNFDYSSIRPIKSTIKKIEELTLNENINIYILSICKTNKIVDDKIKWINKFLPFIASERIVLISKEKAENKNFSSKELKLNYLLNNKDSNKTTIVVDDDNEIIKYIKENIEDILIFQDSSLIE